MCSIGGKSMNTTLNIAILFASIGTVISMLAAIQTWLRKQNGTNLAIRITRDDGTVIEISTRNTQATAEEIQIITQRLAEMLDERDHPKAEPDAPPPSN